MKVWQVDYMTPRGPVSRACTAKHRADYMLGRIKAHDSAVTVTERDATPIEVEALLACGLAVMRDGKAVARF